MNVRFIWSILLGSMLICGSAIGQTKKVVTTASMMTDMTDNIGGGLVSVKTLVPIGGDPHLYEPTPGDAKMVAEADLILVNGLTFEGWIDELIANSGTKAKVVTITEGITPIASAVYAKATDPHAWMDASNGLLYIWNIKNALSELMPEHAEKFVFNHGLYKQELEDLDTWIKAQIETIPSKQRILITSHDAFQYYGRRYGLRLESILGTSTDSEAQTSDIIRLSKVIKGSGIPCVFIESTVNPKLLEQIAMDNKVSIGGKLFADSLGDKDSPAPTYIEMLKYNTNTIVKGLTTVTKGGDSETSPENSIRYWALLGMLLVIVMGFVIFKLNK